MCVQLGLGFVCVYVASGVCIRPVAVLIDSGFCQKDDKNSPTTQLPDFILYVIIHTLCYSFILHLLHSTTILPLLRLYYISTNLYNLLIYNRHIYPLYCLH